MFIREFTTIVCISVTALTILAEPLDKAKVPSAAKWLLHLDVESFRASKLGGHVIEKLLEPKIEKVVRKLNLSINLKNVSSITAYGPAFAKKADGVLMIATTADVKKDLDTLAGMATLSGDEKKKISVVHLEPYLLYSFNDDVFIAPGSGGGVLVAKSKDQIDRAREVLAGKTENLSKSASFTDFPQAAGSFFFLAMAEGFSDNLPIPPQAQVLRETRGGRLLVGENASNIFVNLVFKGKDDEGTLKIQQVLQGIVALVSLSQDNKELTELASSTKISAEGRNVVVNLQIPLSIALEKIDKKAEH
jgi:hypothetical protein